MLFLLALVAASFTATASAARRPNIVVFLVNDMGAPAPTRAHAPSIVIIEPGYSLKGRC